MTTLEIVAAALIAGILSKMNRRHAALCFSFALIYFGMGMLFPNPGVFKSMGYAGWFAALAVWEACVIMAAWIIDTRASTYIALASTLNMMLDVVMGGAYHFCPNHYAHALYMGLLPTYKAIIPGVEIGQVAILYLFSSVGIWIMRRAIRLAVRIGLMRRQGPWNSRLTQTSG